MPVINGKKLLSLEPIKNMETQKKTYQGTSYGLGEAGYDIRIQQEVTFSATDKYHYIPYYDDQDNVGFSRKLIKGPNIVIVDKENKEEPFKVCNGNFIIASAIEEFDMPNNLVAIVHDKSTWARQGISVFNTVIEPGWKGFLTLEIVFHGQEPVNIPSGSGIAQVIFHELSEEASYEGKYQNQENRPIPAIHEN